MRLRIKKITHKTNNFETRQYYIQKEVKFLFFHFWIEIWSSIFAQIHGFCNFSYQFTDSEVYQIAQNYLNRNDFLENIEYVYVEKRKEK